MARITIEDCLQKIDNRFSLIHMAAKRVRLLREGAKPLVVSNNRDIVIALREIAAGEVFLAKKPEKASHMEQNMENELLAIHEQIKEPAVAHQEHIPKHEPEGDAYSWITLGKEENGGYEE
jgi:DNA-directed RNA polymerase subunit omega